MHLTSQIIDNVSYSPDENIAAISPSYESETNSHLAWYIHSKLQRVGVLTKERDRFVKPIASRFRQLRDSCFGFRWLFAGIQKRGPNLQLRVFRVHAGKAGNGKIGIAALPYLAKASSIRAQTVSTDNNSVSVANCNNGCLRGCRDRYKKQHKAENHYLWARIRYVGFASAISDLATGETWIGVGSLDLDVSNDREDWFHLIGSYCLDDLPVLNNQPRRRSKPPPAKK
jgi:hypothetical protein